MGAFDDGTALNRRGSLGSDLGDPTRWGSYVEWQVLVDGRDTGYTKGGQAVMMQFRDLRARAVDFFASYAIDGIDVLDGPFAPQLDGFTGFGLELAIGTGQSSLLTTCSAVRSINEAGWDTYSENGHVVRGVMQGNNPIPVVGLNITPVFRLAASTAAAHTLTIRANVFACPRNSP